MDKKTIIYINQGQGAVTNNNSYLFITTGMTECIGALFVSKTNNAIKALVHFDGDVLYNKDIARDNLKMIKANLDEYIKDGNFEIIAFGGRDVAHNYNCLSEGIYKNFDKNKIKFHYTSVNDYNCMDGDLTITSNGNFGKYKNVVEKEKILKSRYTIENECEISTAEPKNHKIVLFVDSDLKNFAKQKNGR